MYCDTKYFKKKLFGSALFLSLFLVCCSAQANELAATVAEQVPVPEVPPLLSQAEIQQGLLEMQNKINTRIQTWGDNLTRADFERKRAQLLLKPAKQMEVCQIFQSVVDETYQSAQANKQRLTLDDQKLIQNRSLFIQAMGIENNIIPTKLGFDCRIK